jgi:cation diffusion facilitator CzcD-associated flavoprotein CzcO
MTTVENRPAPASTTHSPDPLPDHVDVLIIGAGISGLGAAYHLKDQRPGTSFAILDSLDSYGGTWWTHRYPGVRSDSDLFTLGYRFKAWPGNPIAKAPEILKYLGEVIEENDLDRHIHYRHRIEAVRWSTEDKRWTVEARNLATDEVVTCTAGFVWMCQGYYKHNEGYKPQWPGVDDFEGQILHPQEWPDDVDLAGKKVVVIGSGATAATLIPAIADEAEHVTMLQRTPTFMMASRNRNELADQLRALDVDPAWIHEIVRRQILKMAEMMSGATANPDMLRQFLLAGIKAELPEDFDVERHFNPPYRPWQQRIALLPDGDLFKAIKEGKADVVTDTIVRFTEKGIEVSSGELLEADVIITATGFDLSVLGDIDFYRDGEVVDPASLVTYRGIMFAGLPNLAYVFGYFRASWTLRADIISDFVCRVLAEMEERGATTVEPVLREDERDMELTPWVDPENFNPGYLTRSLHLMPKQGAHEPWRWGAEYIVEKQQLAEADLGDGTLQFR